MRIALPALLLTCSTASIAGDINEAIDAQAQAMRAAYRASPDRPIGVTFPLYERVLAFDMLRGFVPVYENVNGDFYITEFVPDGQSIESWTQMVTVTAQRNGAGSQLDHVTQASQTFDTLNGCNTGLVFKQLGQRQVHPDVSAVIISRSCKEVSGNAYVGAKATGEQNLILHFSDGRDVYTLQFAVRGPFDRGKRPISDAQAIPQLAKFGTIKLCPASGPCEGALKLP